MNDNPAEIFVYKMVVDNGGAPCVARNLLSLAICKPIIRKAAGIGALIFGFGGKKYDERLIYIARVTDQLAGEDYYRLREFARRPDCIYKSANGKAELKKSAKFHKDSDHRKRDVGLKFENAYVLLSHDFRYFGKRGTDDYKKYFPNLKKLVEGLKRGHRNHLNPELRKELIELIELKEAAWKTNKRMIIGVPTDSNFKLACNTDCPSVSC